MRWVVSVIFLLFVLSGRMSAQVSQGGQPMKVAVLKSRGIPVAKMPPVDNHSLQQEKTLAGENGLKLKPLQFAHGFDVNISPETDGVWTYNINGFDVWQMRIVSSGAYSLNLIFEKFHLRSGAKLFLFNEKENRYLGAYTSYNNKSTGKFAVSPLAGDELVVQYEVPAGQNAKNDFVISQVNHDFTGILKYSDRRPRGITAGACNIDINCAEGEKWTDIKDAVCRIIVNGKELCTGTLLNNPREDQRPYVVSAAHCYDLLKYAETSIYTFNYESPYCAPLDGDPSNSVSGSEMRAFSDSLDFSLVELSLVPPPEYRPYFSGWDRRGLLRDSTTSIHHPQGDIKKISYDYESPVRSSFESEYTPNGFLKIRRWDGGVTEGGSSGGPLFNKEKNVIGTLTGGQATCSNPVNDYYARFDLAWEYKPDSSQQLRYWLDPDNQNPEGVEGKRFYENEELCLAYTNLEEYDNHQNVVLKTNNSFAGYWGGTNSAGITEFSEKFFLPGETNVLGVSLGVGIIKLTSGSSAREITVNVYNGRDLPETLIHSETVAVKDLVADAMNFVGFTEPVEPSDTFFVGFEISNLQPRDTFVVYQSLREPDKENFFFFNKDNSWYNFKTENTESKSMTNVFELVVCNVSPLVNDTPLVQNPKGMLIYPNPARSVFIVETGQAIAPQNVNVFNLIGQVVEAKLADVDDRKVEIDLSGNIPGVYFVRVKTEKGMVSKKVIYMPW
ncbi:Por secretion system C-terminal sorting domain-containing protein [Mariniphaga anaerophila]|uniref:Por secretion system C-terminal sorting domain-containing protein n=1 Tax=Mariniphaga anaerophila TaxID=1484053 RepID=A0A1M4XY37_9BACT|nr:T9SS type A sorting domain-containing protein [Mariniphaga anaerophila]SHE98350.1 Por secretion system C-terminal sorting domain-containing protein [Mariniphaga anaerophila]